jgi:hypothetical protein
MGTRVGCVWVDGTVQTAQTWEELETKVREAQYERTDPEGFRAEMGIRAKVWSNVEIDVDGSSEDFFWELERGCLLDRIPDATKVDLTPRKPRNWNMDAIRTGGTDKPAYYGE